MGKWIEQSLGSLIVENKKSTIQVQAASNFGDFPFFTSGDNVLVHDEFIIDGENLYLSTGGVANIKYYNGKAAYSTDTYVIFSEKVNNQYLYYYLLNQIDFINSNLFTGSGLKHLQKRDLKKLKIKLPESKAEQTRIAQILSTADRAIAQTEALIAKYQLIKTGLMQDLLTKGIDEHGRIRSEQTHRFKTVKGLRVPEEWEVVKLETVGTIKGRVGWKGYTVSDLRDTGPLTLGAGNIDQANKLDLTEQIHLAEEKYLESPEIMVKKGDILIVQRGSIGKLCLIDIEIGDATINPSMILLKEININAHFLYSYLCSNHVQKQIKDVTSQTGVPMISQEQCKSIYITKPQPEEQDKISKILLIIENQMNKEVKQLKKLRSIKTGLMQDLLSGRVRVKMSEPLIAPD